jgi:hypothetical protein
MRVCRPTGRPLRQVRPPASTAHSSLRSNTAISTRVMQMQSLLLHARCTPPSARQQTQVCLKVSSAVLPPPGGPCLALVELQMAGIRQLAQAAWSTDGDINAFAKHFSLRAQLVASRKRACLEKQVLHTKNCPQRVLLCGL